MNSHTSHMEVSKVDNVVDLENPNPQPVIAVNVRHTQDILSIFSRGLASELHVKCIFLTLLVVGLIVVQYVVGVPFPFTYMIIIANVIVYVIYLFDCFNADTLKYLSGGEVNASDYVRRITTNTPTLLEEAHCYHYETRTRQVSNTVTDSDGNSRTEYTTETYEELVTTHTERINISFARVFDHSEVPDLASQSMLCRVTCLKSWIPTRETESVYTNIKQRFHAKHMTCDTCRTFSSLMTIVDFRDKVLTCNNKEDIPFAVKHGYTIYIVMSFCLLSWLYRVYLSGVSIDMTLHVKKTVEVLPTDI